MQLQAQQRMKAAQARLDRVRQEAVQQIVVAQNAARSALAAEEAAQQLRAPTAVTLEAYRHGVGTITAVLLANTQMLQAGQALADARAAAQSTAITLTFATGSLGASPR